MRRAGSRTQSDLCPLDITPMQVSLEGAGRLEKKRENRAREVGWNLEAEGTEWKRSLLSDDAPASWGAEVPRPPGPSSPRSPFLCPPLSRAPSHYCILTPTTAAGLWQVQDQVLLGATMWNVVLHDMWHVTRSGFLTQRTYGALSLCIPSELLKYCSSMRRTVLQSSNSNNKPARGPVIFI